MNKLPDETTLLSMLEKFEEAEKMAHNLSNMATEIKQKYQKRIQEFQPAQK